MRHFSMVRRAAGPISRTQLQEELSTQSLHPHAVPVAARDRVVAGEGGPAAQGTRRDQRLRAQLFLQLRAAVGPAAHLVIEKCRMYGPGEHPHRTSDRHNCLAGLNIQPGSWDGTQGRLDDVTIRDITMDKVGTPFYFVLNKGNTAGRIAVSRVKATGVYYTAASVESWAETPFGEVSFRDVSIEFAGGGKQPRPPRSRCASRERSRPLARLGVLPAKRAGLDHGKRPPELREGRLAIGADCRPRAATGAARRRVAAAPGDRAAGDQRRRTPGATRCGKTGAIIPCQAFLEKGKWAEKSPMGCATWFRGTRLSILVILLAGVRGPKALSRASRLPGYVVNTVASHEHRYPGAPAELATGVYSARAETNCLPVVVARTPEALQEDRGDLWDSGRVASNQSVNVPYEGKPLISGQRRSGRSWSGREGAVPPGAIRLSGKWGCWSPCVARILDQRRQTAAGQGRQLLQGLPAPLFRKEFKVTRAVRTPGSTLTPWDTLRRRMAAPSAMIASIRSGPCRKNVCPTTFMI